MTTIWKQSRKTLPGVYAFSLQEQTGVRIIVRRIRELQLRDPLFIPAHKPALPFSIVIVAQAGDNINHPALLIVNLSLIHI